VLVGAPIVKLTLDVASFPDLAASTFKSACETLPKRSCVVDLGLKTICKITFDWEKELITFCLITNLEVGSSGIFKLGYSLLSVAINAVNSVELLFIWISQILLFESLLIH
jgi:hypothetical protein